jgi:hypothetical protein
MAVVGGDLSEITFNHPTLGSGTIFVKVNEDSTFDLGGFRSEDDEKGLDSGGNMIDVMTRSRWSVESVAAWDMNVREDLEKVTQMAESPEVAQWTISHINGAVYQASGKPVGDLKGAGKSATFPLKLSGGGKLKKISG